VVTLRGNVTSYAEKVAAEHSALRVYGVKGVANDLAVRPAGDTARNDTEIAQAAVTALGWNAMVPREDRSGIQTERGNRRPAHQRRRSSDDHALGCPSRSTAPGQPGASA